MTCKHIYQTVLEVKKVMELTFRLKFQLGKGLTDSRKRIAFSITCQKYLCHNSQCLRKDQRLNVMRKKSYFIRAELV